MVHRPADSRLLTNLLQHEKEYSKQLGQLLDYSNASLASFAAYAAASPQPASQIILAVAGSLAASDDALRRYAHSVDQWRETMGHLKDMEDEVGNIMRDREILVTRLIKASKSTKTSSGQKRDSLLLNQQQFASSSTLSLNGQSDSPSSSRPLSLSFGTSSKLAAAQSELQACEMHLATKERELAVRRSTAVREGLGARVKAMIECGWSWGELGKESLRHLETLTSEHEHHDGDKRRTSHDSYAPNGGALRQLLGSAEIDAQSFSSLGPSQSASQTNHDAPHPPNNITAIINGDPHASDSTLLHRPNGVHPDSTLLPHSAPGLDNIAPGDVNGFRPPSGTSTFTGTSSMYLTPEAIVAASSAHKLDYAPAVAIHLPPSSTSASVGSPGAAPHSLDIHDETYKSMKLPAPHAMEGYVGIPVATPEFDRDERGSEVAPPKAPIENDREKDRRSSRSRSPSKRYFGSSSAKSNSPGSGPPSHSGSAVSGGAETSNGSGKSTPLFGVTSQSYQQFFQPHPNQIQTQQQQSPKRMTLQRRITEEDSEDEEVRRKSLQREEEMEAKQPINRGEAGHVEENVDDESSSVEEEVLKEVDVVENPKFMSDTRKRELEKEKAKASPPAAPTPFSTAQEPTGPDHLHNDQEGLPKEKKRFTFMPSHGRTASQSSVPRALSSDVGRAPPPHSLLLRSAAADVPSPLPSPLHLAIQESHPQRSASPTKMSSSSQSKQASPSKGFMGSLRGFFGSKEKDKANAKAKTKRAVSAPPPAAATGADASDGSISEDERPRNGNALHNLFHHNRSPTKKRDGSILTTASASGTGGGKWETRTDKNIRELAKRGSFERAGGNRSQTLPVMGLAAETVAKAGVKLDEEDTDTPMATSPSRPRQQRAGSVDSVVRSAKANGQERTRTTSDVGIGAKSTPTGQAGKRLKKARNQHQGPPLSGSAAAAAAGSAGPSFIGAPKKTNSTSTVATAKPTKTDSVGSTTPVPVAPQKPSAFVNPTAGPSNTAPVRQPASSPTQKSARAGTSSPPKPKTTTSTSPTSAGTPGLALSFGLGRSSSSATAPIKPALTKNKAKKSDPTKRSASVDVTDNRRSFVSQNHPLAIDSSDEEDAAPTSMRIVDLGQRRRAESELGDVTDVTMARTRASGVGSGDVIHQRAGKHAFVPTPAPGVGRPGVGGSGSARPVPVASGSAIRGVARGHDEYASDTAAFAPGAAVPTKRKKSLTKKDVSKTSSMNETTTPARKPSVKATAPPHQKAATVSGVPATVLSAGGGHPSGTLVSMAGKGSQMHVSGGLSRNSSIAASGSGVSGVEGLGKPRRSNTLGQGMTGSIGGGNVSRKGSVSVTSSAMATSTSTTSTSLMDIVGDISRGNREGWAYPAPATPKTTAAKKPPATMVDVVKAPARVGRETLEALDAAQIRHQFTHSTDNTATASASTSTRAPGLLDIKAPASVFDERYSSWQASASTPDLSATRHTLEGNQKANKRSAPTTRQILENIPDKPQATSTPTRRASVSAEVTPSVSRPPRASANRPLKSALRNPSPVPSSQNSNSPSPVPGPSRHLHPTHVSSPPPHQNVRSPHQDRPTKPMQQSHKVPGRGGENEEEASGDDGASSTSYETGNEVFYTDEEAEAEQPNHRSVTQHQPEPASHSQSTNGHAAGYGSEQSGSTLLGSTTQQQAPRRRKSVRVSLQPTFSPSPPAIEYSEEESRSHPSSSWQWQPDRQHTQPLIAPVPILHKPVSDLWVDSSEEDEDYQRAKRALSRAARKDKEVKAMTANRDT